jgi:hypothetical protein
MLPDGNIGVAGYKGMAGSSILCKWQAKGHRHLVLYPVKRRDRGHYANGKAKFRSFDGILSVCNDVKDKL